MLSRICEEFGCLPSEALQEDANLVLSIMELRAYARAKAAVESPNATEENTTEWQKAVVFGVVEKLSKRV